MDFNIHLDTGSDSLTAAFNIILDSIGFTQRVKAPTHLYQQTLDLVLTYGLECKEVTHNSVLSDRFLNTYEFTLTDLPKSERKYHYSITLSDKSVISFKEYVPYLLPLVSQNNTMEGSNSISNLSEIDGLIHSITSLVSGVRQFCCFEKEGN